MLGAGSRRREEIDNVSTPPLDVASKAVRYYIEFAIVKPGLEPRIGIPRQSDGSRSACEMWNGSFE